MKITAFTPVAACLLMLITACSKEKKNEADEQAVPAIEVAAAAEDSILIHKSFPGLVASEGEVNVVARVSGTLISKRFRDGDRVSKGQVLYTIDATQFQNAVKEAEAALASAKSQVEYATKRCEAMKKAYEADAVAHINLIEAESTLKQAIANVSSYQAQLDQARTQLGYCTIVAPISGQITESKVDVGSFVTAESVPLCTIVDNARLKVTFAISDAQYQHLLSSGTLTGKGGPVFSNVPLDFGADVPGNYTTSLFYVAPAVDASTGTIELEGAVKDATGRIKAGMYTTVLLPTEINPHAIIIKDAAIGTDQLGKYVYAVNDSNKVVYTPIKVGELYQDSLRVVSSGLSPGQRYVTKALLTVRNGMKIKPVLTR